MREQKISVMSKSLLPSYQVLERKASKENFQACHSHLMAAPQMAARRSQSYMSL